MTWTLETVRGDGLRLQQSLNGAWIILPRDDRAALDHCPCCGEPFESAAAGRLVADRFYPVDGDGAGVR